MISPQGFHPHAFIIGLHFQPAFTFEDVRGTIADFALGECGASDSPLTSRDFFTGVSIEPSLVRVANDDKSHRLVVSRDRILYAHVKAQPSDASIPEEDSILVASHLLDATYRLLREPPTRFLGIVWDYVRLPSGPTEKFSHEIAKDIADRFININLNSSEYPAQASFRLNFRRRLPQALVRPDIDDFLAVILTLEDTTYKSLYEARGEPNDERQEVSVGLFRTDVQRHLDPFRRFEEKLIAEHLQSSRNLLHDRLLTLLNA